MYTWTFRGQKGVLDPLKQELVVVVSCLMWVLNSGLSKRGCTLNYWSHLIISLIYFLFVYMFCFFFFLCVRLWVYETSCTWIGSSCLSCPNVVVCVTSSNLLFGCLQSHLALRAQPFLGLYLSSILEDVGKKISLSRGNTTTTTPASVSVLKELGARLVIYSSKRLYRICSADVCLLWVF